MESNFCAQAPHQSYGSGGLRQGEFAGAAGVAEGFEDRRAAGAFGLAGRGVPENVDVLVDAGAGGDTDNGGHSSLGP
jgi:hypothetical protein